MKIASVSIFQGKKGEIIIFPMWRDVNGISRDSVNFQKLTYGYTDYELGTKILSAVEVSKKNEQEEPNQEVYKNASSYKSWNAFQKNFEYVVIVIFDTGDWRIARYLKQKGHSYGLNKDQLDKYTKIFSEPLSPEVLGKVVLEMFDMK